MDAKGFEPPWPGCKPGILPLNDAPGVRRGIRTRLSIFCRYAAPPRSRPHLKINRVWSEQSDSNRPLKSGTLGHSLYTMLAHLVLRDGVEPPTAAFVAQHPHSLGRSKMERTGGFEPPSEGWKPSALPLGDARSSPTVAIRLPPATQTADTTFHLCQLLTLAAVGAYFCGRGGQSRTGWTKFWRLHRCHHLAPTKIFRAILTYTLRLSVCQLRRRLLAASFTVSLDVPFYALYDCLWGDQPVTIRPHSGFTARRISHSAMATIPNKLEDRDGIEPSTSCIPSRCSAVRTYGPSTNPRNR